MKYGLMSGILWAIDTVILGVALSMGIYATNVHAALVSATFHDVFAALILLVYTMQSIASVFFITAGTFAVMAAIGYFTKADLSSLGKILMMALIGLIIATVVNAFLLKSGGFSLILSYVGVLIFVGLTAYDTQKIKQMLIMADDVNEETQKIALLGSLSLYLDFINLFLYLLRIFGNSRE
mgnify:CR=1 FL=1